MGVSFLLDYFSFTFPAVVGFGSFPIFSILEHILKAFFFFLVGFLFLL